MSLLNKIRNKPQHEKIRLVWIIAGTAFVIMIIIWIILGGIRKNTPKDLSLFRAISKSFQEINNDFQSRIKK